MRYLVIVFLISAKLIGQSLDTTKLLRVKYILDSLQIEESRTVLAQVVCETGWLNCKHCCLDKNNLFGFIGKKGCIKFDNWVESCVYYKKWQDLRWSKYKSKHKNPDYISFLKSKYSGPYARSKTYDKYVKIMLTKLKNYGI